MDMNEMVSYIKESIDSADQYVIEQIYEFLVENEFA